MAGLTRPALLHAVRTAIAAVVSFLAARELGLKEAYWAPITTMIVLQSTLGAAWTVSTQRLAGTALGAVVGAASAAYVGSGAAVFGAGVVLLGVICAAFHLDRAAYRFAGITLAVVMLIARSQPPWVLALHRFIEVSLGIAVGLLLTAIWPETKAASS